MYPFRNESKDPENWEDDPEPKALPVKTTKTNTKKKKKQTYFKKLAPGCEDVKLNIIQCSTLKI